jgi:RNA polymerase sigma-70 factor (ECF subfamily)
VAVAKYRGFVRSQLLRYGAAPSELDDLIQEVWLVALARSPEFVDERATCAWLAQVSRRIAAGERRARARKPLLGKEVLELAVEPDQVAGVERELDDLDGLAALASLSEELRDVLSLYGSGDLTMREVAELLALPEPTAYSRYRNALEQVERELRRRTTTGVRPASIPPVSTAGRVACPELDREALADEGELLIYRADAETVIGRIGNVVVSRWRQRFYPRTLLDLGSVVDLAYERLQLPVVLVNDGGEDLHLPSAAERSFLRSHLNRHAHRAAIAVDILNTPVTRVMSAIVQGALLITRAPTSFSMVPSLDQARRWIEPYARTASGKLAWPRIVEAVELQRRYP